MGLLTRRVPFDRKRMLEKANALSGTWRWRKALALYRQVLAAEPRCADLHGKVAPLLARSGRRYEAWDSFSIAIEARRSNEDLGGARSLLVQAVKQLPFCTEAYRALARVELARGRRAEAVSGLLRGSRQLVRKRRVGEAIVLLRDAREIDKWSPQVMLPLCRLLARDGQPAEALFLLDELAAREPDGSMREIRRLLFRIEPSVSHGFRWLRTPKSDRPRDGAVTASRS